MIIDHDNFTKMTILPFGVQDWATDRQYRQLHRLLDTVASLLNLPPKSDGLDGTSRAVMDMFGSLFASYDPNVSTNASAIVREPTVTKNSESYDPANTQIIVLSLENPKRTTLFLGTFAPNPHRNEPSYDPFFIDLNTVHPTYKFDLDKASERQLAATVILAMCEHENKNQWKPVISKTEKK